MAESKRTVQFTDVAAAEQAAAIAERICDDVSVDGLQVTLWGDMSVIGDTLREVELCGIMPLPLNA